MANAFTYAHNLGKSIKYSAVDTMKNMNPAVSSFIETNQEGITNVYKSIKNIKETTNTASSKMMDNKYTEFAKNAKKNLFDDIKTGKFYNKERLEKESENTLKGTMFDFNLDDPFDEGDTDFNFSDTNDSSMDTKELTSMMDIVGEKSSMAIATSMARSAHYTVAANKESTKVLYDQNNAIFARINSGMGNINTNISNLVKFANEGMIPHFENSKLFFEKTNQLDQERNDLLKQILEIQKSSLTSREETNTNSSQIKYDDIVNAEGIPDLAKYAQAVKQNITESSAGMGDMMKMAVDMMLGELSASPLKIVTDSIVKTFIPGVLKEAMGSFNNTLSGVFSSAMMKLNNNNDFGILGTIKDYLGIDQKLKTNIDTSKYKKGKVDFDGITRKSIIEVIPTYLSKILSAITNGEETRYDFEKGKFINLNKIKNELNSSLESKSTFASSGITEYTNKYKDSLKMSKKDEELFDQDLKQILLESFKRGNIFDFRNKNTNAKDYNLKNGKKSDQNIEIIKEMFEQMPRGQVMQYANEIFSARSAFTKEMEDLENKGGIYSNLYNNSKFNSNNNLLSGNNKLSDTIEKIYKELSYIRQFGLPKVQSYDESTDYKNARPKFSSFKPDTTAKKTTKNRENRSKAKRMTSSNSDDDAAAARQNAKEKIEAYKNKDRLNRNNENFFSKLENAASLTEKASVITSNIDELVKKPGMFLASILEKADNRLFDLIYGSKDNNDGTNTISGILFKNLTESFQKFNNWLDEKILNPLSKKFTKENAKNAVKRFFNIFDIDIEKSVKDLKTYLFGEKDDKGNKSKNGIFGDFIDSVKGGFSDAFSYIKNSFKDVFSFFKNKTNKNKSTKSDNSNNTDTGIGDIENAASGMRRVKRTGIVAVSEGEMIIPPDLNPYNIKKRQTNENKAKEKFQKYTGSNFNIKGFAEGTNNINEDDIDNDKNSSFFSDAIFSMGQAAKNLKDQIFQALNSGKNNSDKKETNKMISDTMDIIKKHAPEMVTGGIIGGGVSLITGAIGGPLLGAAAGASIALIKNSDKVQKWLFGENIDGERQGGLISKDLSNNIEKYFPDMAKGATVGGITSILPFVPGGPVSGIILGSAVGFAKNNDKVKNYLFGEDGLLGEDFPKKVKKALPTMGLGAVTGLVAGPFGVATNMLLGSVGGFALSSDKFQDYLFGEKDDDGNRTGGLVKEIKENFEKHFVNPAKYVFDPVVKQFELIGKKTFDIISNKIEKTMDSFHGTLLKFLNSKFMKPLTNLLNKTIINPAKSIAKTPGNAVNWIGDKLRKRHIKKGNADYMTADQRLFFADSFGMKNNKFSQIDKILSNMNEEDLENVKEGLGLLQNNKKESKKMKKSAMSKITRGLSSEKDLDYKKQNKIIDMLRAGDIKGATNFASKLGLNNQDSINELLSSQGARLSLANKSSKDIQGMRGQITDYLKSMGIKVKDEDLDKLYNYTNTELKSKRKLNPQEKKEQELSKFDSELNKRQQKRYDEMMKFIKNIQSSLDIIAKNNKNYEKSKKEDLKQSADKNLGKNEKPKKSKSLAAALLGFGSVDREPAYADGVAVASEGEKILSRKEAKRLKRQQARDRVIKNYAKGGTVDFDNNDDSILKKILNSIKNITNPKLRAKNNIETEKEENKLSRFSKVRKAKTNGLDRFTKSDEILQDSGTDKVIDSKNSVTSFVNGKAIKFIRNKSNSYEPDVSDSETKQNLKDIKEQEETTKSISGKISNLTEGFKGFASNFFNRKNKEDEEKPSLLSKIGSIAKKAFIAATAIGTLPILNKFWKNTAKPALDGILEPIGTSITDLKTSVVEHLKQIPSKLIEGVSLIKDFMVDKLPAIFQNYIIPYYVNGMDFLLGSVVPKLAEVIGKSLPSILSGFFKGVISALKTNIKSALGNRPSTDPTDKDFNFTSNVTNDQNSSSSEGVASFFGRNKNSSVGDSYTYRNNSYWNLSPTKSTSDSSSSISDNSDYDQSSGGFASKIANFISGKKNKSKEAIEELKNIDISDKKSLSKFANNYNDEGLNNLLSQNVSDKKLKSLGLTRDQWNRSKNEEINNYLNESYGNGSIKTPIVNGKSTSNTQLPLAFNYVNKKVKKDVEAQYRKIEDKSFTIDNDGNTLSLREILNSKDLPVGQLTDSNTGQSTTVYGVDILKYADVASAYGINIPSSSSILLDSNKSKNKKWTENSIGAKGLKGVVKSFARGGAGIMPTVFKATGKVLDNKIVKSVPIVGQASSIIGKGIKGYGNVLEKSGEAGSKFASRMASVGSEEVIEGAAKSTSKSQSIAGSIITKGKKVASKAKDALKNDKAVKAVKESSISKKFVEKAKNFSKKDNKGILSKFANAVKTKIYNFITNNKVSSFILEKLAKKGAEEGALKAFAKKFSESIAGKLLKSAGKALAKIGAAAATLMASTVVQAIYGFYKGYRDANSILGVVDQPSIPTRLIIAICSAINESFLLGIIDMDILFDLALAAGKSLFNIDTSKIDKEREDSANKVKEYNREHGTNYSVEEYNKKDRFSTKAKKFVGDAWSKTKKTAGNIASKAGDIKDNIVGGFKSFGNDLANGTIYNNIKSKGKEIIGNVSSTASNIKDNIVSGAKTFGKNASKYADKATGGFFNNNTVRDRLDISDDKKVGIRERFSTAVGSGISSITGLDSKGVSKTINGGIYQMQNALPNAIDAANKNLGSALGLTDDKGNTLSLTESASYNFTKLRKKASKGFTNITNSLKDTWNNIQEKGSKKWDKFKDHSQKALDKTNDNLGSFFGMVDEDGKPLSLTDGIKKNWSKLKKIGSDKFNSIVKTSKDGLSSLKDKASKGYKGFKENSKKALSETNKNLGSFFGMVDEDGKPLSLTSGLKRKWGSFRQDFADNMNNIISNSREGLKDISEKASKGFENFKNDTKKALSETNKNLGSFFGMVDEDGKPLSLTDGIKKDWGSFRDGIAKKWSKLQKGAKGIWDKFTGWMDNVGKSFRDTSDKVESGGNSGLPTGSGSGLINYIKSKVASGSKSKKKNKQTFVSQIDSKYKNTQFNTSKDSSKQTIADNGCGPAAATMVINNTKDVSNDITMEQATREALNYKVKDGGVSADYFKKVFSERGLNTKYIISQNSQERINNISDSLQQGQKVILMGKDPSNKSKSKSPFGPNDHYVVANKLSKDGKYVYINDPESKKPNKKYLSSKVLSNTEMGIAAYHASGSGVSKNISKKYYASGSTSKITTQNLGSFSKLTAEQINSYLKKHAPKNSPFRGNGSVFVEASEKSGLDPRYIIAHAAEESGWGTSNIARKKGNYFGIGAFDASPYKSAYSFKNNLHAGIVEGAKWIANNYYKRGQTTLKLMSKKPHQYATNSDWTTNIAKIMSHMPKNTNISYSTKIMSSATSSSGTGGETIWQGKKYSLSSSEISFLATIITGEGGSYKDHAEALASHMANLYESKGGDKKYGSIYKWLKSKNSKGNYGGGWYARSSVTRGKSKVSIEAVKKCIVNGYRKLPFNVIEFDYYKSSSNSGDISIIGGTSVSKATSGKTKVRSRLGAGSGKFYKYFGDGSKNASSGNLFWVPDSCKINPGTPTTIGSGSGSSEKKSYNTLLDALGVFDELGSAFGLTESSNDDSSDKSSDSSSNITGTGSEKQKELVKKMDSYKGKLKYSQSGPRNPDKGSADCSSTVNHVYKKVLGVDIGGYTGAQYTNKNLKDVDKGTGSASSKPDESKLQLGDILLFKRSSSSYKDGVGHVEMYMGNGKQMGHGSGIGPKEKPLQGSFLKARRYKGFINSGSGSGILSNYSAAGSGLVETNENNNLDNKPNKIKNIILNTVNDKKDKLSKNIAKIKKYAAGTNIYELNKNNESSNNININNGSNFKSNDEPQITIKENSSKNILSNYNNLDDNKTNNSNIDKSVLISILKSLIKISNNTDTLNTIVTLLTKIVTSKSDTTNIENKDVSDEQKREYQTASVLKQNLINTLNNSNATTDQQELMMLIKSVEELAKE